MWRKYVLIALIVGMPTLLLAWRLITDDRAYYGWGWQMFS
jgi:hypothetical protein